MEDIEDLLPPRGFPEVTDFGSPSVASSTRSVTPPRRSRPSGEVYAKQSTRRVDASESGVPGTQTVFLKTQGCSHNVSDGEYMAGLLASYGYSITQEWSDDVDVFLFNSCTVKGPSQDSFLNMVSKAKESGKAVVVAGCVPQGQPDRADLQDLSIVGVQQIHRVVEVVEEALKGNSVKLLGQSVQPALDLPKIRRNALVEIVPISVGCLNNCTYCKTKHARGDLGSYEPSAIVSRIESVVNDGVREIWLSSEDTGAYGKDIGVPLPALLDQVIGAIPDGVMLRIGMTNPPHILEHVEGVARALNHPRVFKFLHIPVQCGSDKVLSDMKREYTVADFEKLADYMIANVPGITIATDVICGFPTETEEDFEGTMQLLDKYRFPVVNIAQFYPRPGTAAAKLTKLPSSIVKDRSRKVTSFFESYATWDSMVGTTQKAWVVEYGKDPKYVVAHTRNYAQCLVPRDDGLIGKCVNVRIESAEKWCVKSTLISVEDDAEFLPQVSISRTNVLPSPDQIESSAMSGPRSRRRAGGGGSWKPREEDSWRISEGGEGVEAEGGKDGSGSSGTPKGGSKHGKRGEEGKAVAQRLAKEARAGQGGGGGGGGVKVGKEHFAAASLMTFLVLFLVIAEPLAAVGGLALCVLEKEAAKRGWMSSRSRGRKKWKAERVNWTKEEGGDGCEGEEEAGCGQDGCCMGTGKGGGCG